jgi:MFS transporter, PHS family, inorganic phosphate transporter
MTGKPLNEFQREILRKLLQIQKLTNHDIAFVLEVDERTIRRRRYEFAATGNLAKKRDVSKNAEKLKPLHLEVCICFVCFCLCVS